MKFFSYSLIIAVSHLNATNEHPMAPHNDLYQFHYGSQLPVTESYSQRTTRLASQKRIAAQIGATLRNTTARNHKRRNNDQEASNGHQPDYVDDELGFNNNSFLWEDTEHIMSEEDKASPARMRPLHQE
ncbi:hypothetical protein MJO29_014966 [Puccinia striiformis f. sp. tritici]|nr:hypothetical protein MJO29_014966 [Puccinia striiformis f. sp. tritici]